MNFLDPQLTEDGKPYGPARYKNIVKERYYIAKNGHISYEATGKMTPLEREYIKQFIVDDAKAFQEQIDKMKENKNTPKK